MVKTEELRIGNFIQMDTSPGEYKRVKGIHSEDHAKFIFVELTENLKYYAWNTIFTEPIPITEEWLKRFGFNHKDGWGYYKDFPGQVEGEQIAFYQGAYYVLPTDGPTTSHWIRVKIMYVHQLQNLFFALTGQELTITE